MAVTECRVEQYLHELARITPDSGVFAEMDRHAEIANFPHVGPRVGRLLELVAGTIRPRRVFEFGSGFGYSACWFARSMEPGSELHLTDYDPDNGKRSVAYVNKVNPEVTVRFHAGEALETFARIPGDFDLVFCDINDEIDYPKVWEASRPRIRPGGMYICDNALEAGPSLNAVTLHEGPGLDGYAAAIRRHNELVITDPHFVSSLIPLRSGVIIARRRNEIARGIPSTAPKRSVQDVHR